MAAPRRLALRVLLTLVAATATARAQAPADHVVLVILGGGARTADLALMPKLGALGREGVRYSAVRCAATDDAVATRALLTGRPVGASPATAIAPERATLLEHLLEVRALPRHEAWLLGATADGLESLAPRRARMRRAAAAPRILALDSLGLPGLVQWTRSLGPSPRLDPAARRAGDALRRLLETPAAAPPPQVMEALATLRAQQVESPGPPDDAVLAATRAVALGVRPRLTVAVLSETAVARTDATAYREALARNDAALAGLVAALRGPEGLGARGAVFVAAAHGWNRRAEGGALGTNDGSIDVQRTWLFAWGPGFRSGHEVKAAVDGADLAPTIARLLALPEGALEGRPLRGLLERR